MDILSIIILVVNGTLLLGFAICTTIYSIIRAKQRKKQSELTELLLQEVIKGYKK